MINMLKRDSKKKTWTDIWRILEEIWKIYISKMKNTSKLRMKSVGLTKKCMLQRGKSQYSERHGHKPIWSKNFLKNLSVENCSSQAPPGLCHVHSRSCLWQLESTCLTLKSFKNILYQQLVGYHTSQNVIIRTEEQKCLVCWKLFWKNLF